MKLLYAIAICIVCAGQGLSQKILEIDIVRFNKLKTIQLFNNSLLEYKLKGEYHYRINKITNLSDSSILFSNDSIIRLSQLKAIKLRNGNRLYHLFSNFFYTGGVLFVGLDTFNNAINGETPVVKPLAVYVSAGLIATGFIIKQLSIKRIRINKRKTLRILEADYQNLSK